MACETGDIPSSKVDQQSLPGLEESLKRLHDNCEFVVIDSSPVLPVSDALLLAKLVDGVIVVANGTTTPRQQIRNACARIEYARGKILGVVLNRIKVNNPEYRYYYHHEYYTLSADDHPHEVEFA